jgi:hypothetical protein
MNCSEAREKLLLADGELRLETDAARHLEDCRSCQAFLAALQEEDRTLRAALSYTELDFRRISELEKRTRSALDADTGVSVGWLRVLLPASAALGGVAVVSLTGIETETLQIQLRDALLGSRHITGMIVVLAASLVSAALGIAAGRLCRNPDLKGPLKGESL